MKSVRRSLIGQILMGASLFGGVGLAAEEPVTFRLHKFQQAIGTETDSFSKSGHTLRIDTDFSFTDRGTKVPLKATLRCSGDYTPSSFTISGSTSRSSQIDISVAITGHSAKIKDGKASRDVTVPARFFTISGYAPAMLQETLLRYWLKHGRPAELAVLPSGSVRITDRGKDVFVIGGERIRMRRFSVSGLVWGLETLWLDDKGRLAAVITRDAEFDHFEAVREPYELALAEFIGRAAQDETAHLAEISETLAGRRTGPLAVVGATLINITDGSAITNATVVVRGGRITAAGEGGSTAIPADAKRIDGSGKFIIPGLWDMHAHYEQVEWGAIYLAAGVTTVRDVGNEFAFITAVRDANNGSHGLGPRMLLAGIVDGDGPIALGIQRVNSEADAAAWVKKYHDAGFQQIKIYSSVKPEMVKAICREAHAAGMTVTGHIPIGMSVLDGIDAGMDQVNHFHYVAAVAFGPKVFEGGAEKMAERMALLQAFDVHSEQVQRLIATLREHGTVIDDTVALSDLFGLSAALENGVAEPGIRNVAPELREQFESGGVSAENLPFQKLLWNKSLLLMGALHQAGVRFVAGTDQAVPGYSVYREMELYVRAGFTPLEALQAATLVPAQVMKMDAESGSVTTGKRADFVVLDRNPLQDIQNVRTVRLVVANGVLYDPKPLWEAVGFRAPE